MALTVRMAPSPRRYLLITALLLAASALPHLMTAFTPIVKSTPQRKQQQTRHTLRFATSKEQEDKAALEAWSQEFFTDDSIDYLEAKLTDYIDIPGVPTSVISYIMSKVAEKIVTNLEPTTMNEFRALLDAKSSVKPEVRQDLAAKIAAEINPSIDIPIISEEDEEVVLKKVVVGMLEVMTSSGWMSRKFRIKKYILTGQKMLDPEKRDELVTALNAAVDVPFMNEEQEQKMMQSALDSMAESINTWMPQELLLRLKGENQIGIEEMKFYLSEKFGNAPFLSLVPKDKRDWLITEFLDLTFDEIENASPEMKLWLLNPEERIDELISRREKVYGEIRVLKRQIENLELKATKLDGRVKQEKERTGSSFD